MMATDRLFLADEGFKDATPRPSNPHAPAEHWLEDQVGDLNWKPVAAISARCWGWAVGLSLPMWATLIVLGAWVWRAVK